MDAGHAHKGLELISGYREIRGEAFDLEPFRDFEATKSGFDSRDDHVGVKDGGPDRVDDRAALAHAKMVLSDGVAVVGSASANVALTVDSDWFETVFKTARGEADSAKFLAQSRQALLAGVRG
jgi:hypothetical protein